MRKFIFNNFLSILVCLFTTSLLASATVINRPYSASDYAGGTKAVGSKVNAEFQNIVTWLNGGNISTGNIATFGIGSTNLADGIVTLAKLAAVTVSSTTITAYTTNTTVTGVTTGLSKSFTSTGRPVEVQLYGYFSGTPSDISVGSNTQDPVGYLEIYRDTTRVYSQKIGMEVQTPGLTFGASVPASAFRFIDAIAAGTYTYSVRGYVVSSASTLSLTNVGMQVFER